VSKRVTRSLGATLLREWRGETAQAEVCKLFNVDPATYCKFESGARRPGGRWAARIEALTGGKVPASSWHHPAHAEALAS
jgi:hypothetical protein